MSRREKPRGSLGRSLNPLGVLYPVCRPAGDRTSLGLRRWPKPAAVRSEDRSPRFREVCKPFGLLAVSSFDDPEGSPLGLPTARCLRFPFGFGLNLLFGFPSFRFSLPFGFPFFQPDLPDGLPPFWPVVGFPLRRERKSRPSPDLPQARLLYVFRELDSLFRDPVVSPMRTRETPRKSRPKPQPSRGSHCHFAGKAGPRLGDKTKNT